MADAIKIKKILEAGKVVYPATILDAVKDAKSVKVDGAETNKWYGLTLRDILVDEDTTLKGLISAEESARKTQVGNLGKVSDAEDAADHTVKSYVDAAIEAVNGDASTLGGRVKALEGLHGTKTVGEGDDAKEVFKTVEEEVNEAVTDLIDGAPAALDTLKEIADWIANQDESGVTDVTSLLARVEANAQAISDEEGRATDAEEDLSERIQALEEAKYTTVNAKAEGHVTVTVSTDNEVTVEENDIASAEFVGTLPSGASATTVTGYAAEVAAAEASAVQGDTESTIKDVEDALQDHIDAALTADDLSDALEAAADYDDVF